jgi:hypothetical protein
VLAHFPTSIGFCDENGHVDQIQHCGSVSSDCAHGHVAVDCSAAQHHHSPHPHYGHYAIDTVIGTVADISVVGSQLVAGSVQTGQFLFFVLQMLDEVTRSADYSSHPERPIVGK